MRVIVGIHFPSYYKCSPDFPASFVARWKMRSHSQYSISFTCSTERGGMRARLTACVCRSQCECQFVSFRFVSFRFVSFRFVSSKFLEDGCQDGLRNTLLRGLKAAVQKTESRHTATFGLSLGLLGFRCECGQCAARLLTETPMRERPALPDFYSYSNPLNFVHYGASQDTLLWPQMDTVYGGTDLWDSCPLLNILYSGRAMLRLR
jgi:hypothetical protein